MSSEKLLQYLDEAIKRLFSFADLKLHTDVRFQVEQDLRTYFYKQLLNRKSTSQRIIRLSNTTSRDGQQSNKGTNLTGLDQWKLLSWIVKFGNVSTIESWGGAANQSAVLKTKRIYQVPGQEEPLKNWAEDPFFNLREQTKLLEDNLKEAFGEDLDRLEDDDRERIFNRYKRDFDRKILSEFDLNAILKRYNLSEQVKNRVRKVYEIKQEMLLRGTFLVALDQFPEPVVKEFVEVAWRNGVDVFRIFDAMNRINEIDGPLKYARALGAKVQPAIHYTKGFPRGIPKYVELAKELVRISGHALDSLVIKDAAGQLEPEEAYKLVKALRQAGITVPIQIHTHDTNGNRQLTLLEAIRANGEDYPIIVDVSTGELAAPLAQPNDRHFLNIVQGTKWEGTLIKDVDFEQMEQAEFFIKSDINLHSPSVPMTTEDRLRIVRANIPGGLKTNNDNDINNALHMYEKLIRKVFDIIFWDPRGNLTAKGQAFRAALVRLMEEEIPRVRKDMGNFSLVTPTSEWVVKQSLNNVIGWIIADQTVLNTSNPQQWQLSIKEDLLRKNRKSQYLYSVGLAAHLHEDLQNYLVEWTQDTELQDMYPDINTELLAWAFDIEGINIELDDQNRLTDSPLEKFQNLRKFFEKRFVDVPTIKVLHKMEKLREGGDADALENLESQEFSWDLINRILKNEKPMNIIKRPEDYVQNYQQLRNKYPQVKGSPEDKILARVFPKEGQFSNLIETRRILEEQIDQARQNLPADHEKIRSLAAAYKRAGGRSGERRSAASAAMIGDDKDGGINLNPDFYDLQINREGKRAIDFAMQGPALTPQQVQGLTPVILGVKILTHLEI